MTDLRTGGFGPARVPARDTVGELKPIASKYSMSPMQEVGGAHDPAQPAPVLKRPVVMIPGLMLGAESFDNMAQQFKSPSNGDAFVYNAKSGSFHKGSADGPRASDGELRNAKLFQLEPRDKFGAPSDGARDVAEMMQAVKKATGQSTIDAVTHSAGGHRLRSYLDTRSDKSVKLNNVVMVGPVSHGTVIGSAGSIFGGRMPLVGKAADEMKIGGPFTEGLNARFDAQRSQMGSLTVIATNGAPLTVGPGGPSVGGDGFVEPDQAALPGARNLLLTTKLSSGWGSPRDLARRALDATPKNHFDQIGYSGVINHVGEALVR